MTPAPPFSQLWAEESEELFRLGRLVPPGGVIVDIGTAQGGSAFIFHQATDGSRVAIHTFDPQPSREAYTHLAGTPVVLHAQTSVAGARSWTGPPVNLLFVDGSHHLADVVDDFNAWTAHLAAGAMVAFHDYDPVERGGLIHFGVKVALDAMLSRQILTVPCHVGRILSGSVGDGRIVAGDCRHALRPIESRVSLLNATHADWLLPVAAGASVSPGVTSLERCYLLERALIADRSAVLEGARDRQAFFKWEEVLATLDHALGATMVMTDRYARLREGASVADVSAFVASEQVRLVCLTRIYHAVTGREL